MSADPSAFLAEVDARVGDYVAEIRRRAAAAKADLETGALALRRKAGTPDLPPAEPPSAEPWGSGDSFGGDSGQSAAGSFDELQEFEALGEPSNGSHPLDAPIFSDGDSFLSDDLDFSIDLDDSLPS